MAAHAKSWHHARKRKKIDPPRVGQLLTERAVVEYIELQYKEPWDRNCWDVANPFKGSVDTQPGQDLEYDSGNESGYESD